MGGTLTLLTCTVGGLVASTSHLSGWERNAEAWLPRRLDQARCWVLREQAPHLLVYVASRRREG